MISQRSRYVALCVVVLFALVVLAYFFRKGFGGEAMQVNGLPVVKTQEVTDSLVAGFPDIPVYEGAVVKSSFSGVSIGKRVYGSTWEVSVVNGHSADRSSVRTIMHWYEDDAFPQSWQFDEPLQQSGNDVTNPTKSWLTVSKNNVKVTLTVKREDPKGPVIITAFVLTK